MTSTTTDRRFGVNSGMAVKVPCRAATTANVTLSGEQTIDGVALVTGDRVLVKNQTTGANNGVYMVDTGGWTRAKDLNGAYDVVKGSFLYITDGSTLGGSWWGLSTTAPVIGTSTLTFTQTLLGDASTVNFLQAGSGAVARTALAKMREAVTLKDFGAVGDGVTDDSTAWDRFITYLNTQASAAVSSGFPITTAKGSITAGDYNIATGKSVTNLNIELEGDGRENTRIRIGAGQYLLTATSTVYQFGLCGVSTSGGKGVLKHSGTGTNVQGIYTVEDNNFHDYTECAIGSLASDMPYWKIRGNVFYGASALTSKGVALAGARDMSEIEGNAFLRNLYHVKLAAGGQNVKIRDNDFIRFTNGGGAPVLVDVWIIPQTASTNAGDGFEATGNKFGNENLNANDIRMLLADEAAGTDFLDKNHATTVSTGYWIGGRVKDNAVFCVASQTRGFIYSYTPNIRYAEVVNEHTGAKLPYIVEYNASVTFTTDDRTAETNLAGWSTMVDGLETYTGPVSSQASTVLPHDPLGLMQAQTSSIKPWESGMDVSLVEILANNDITAAATTSAAVTPATDALVGGNAIEATYSASGGEVRITLTGGNITVGRTAWIEFDIKQASSLPLTRIQADVRTDINAIAARRILNIPTYWLTVRFPWIPRQNGTTLRLKWFPQDYSAGVKTKVLIGRPRIYHAHEPIHRGYFQQGNTVTQLPAVLKAYVNTTAVGNVGGGTDDLMAYPMPANALSEDKKGVKIRAWGTAANNANAKTLVLAFGSQTLSSQALTVSQVGTWEFEAIVLRTGASAQDWKASFFQEGTVEIQDVDVGTATQTDTAAITIKCTGAATTDNDIVQEGMLVEFLG